MIKEEITELGRKTPQMQTGEPSGSGSRQISGTPKKYILDAFQELYTSWANAETDEGKRYFDELGTLIEELEDAKFLDDKGKF